MKRKTNLIVRIISILLIICLLVAGIGFLYRYTNGFNEDLKTFYIEYDGGKILQSHSTMRLPRGGDVRFDVHYTFDFGEEVRDYSVKVVPNEAESFEYTVDELYMRWRPVNETKDLSEVFGLKKEATFFTLSLPHELSIGTALQALYPDRTVSVPDAGSLDQRPLYTLEIVSYNGEISFLIDFSLFSEGLFLNAERVVF